MATITLQNYRDGALSNATSVKLRDSGGTFGIRKTDDLTVAVAPTAAITPSSTGIYPYDYSAIVVPGEYEAQWEVITGADTDYVQHIFNVDAAEIVQPGPSLCEIEAEVARRIGPFRSEVVASGSTGSFVVNKLKTAADIGGFEDTYILRRGYKADGTRVSGYNSDDRVRLVFEYDHDGGELTPDRVYNVAPVADEVIELLSLRPDDLRYAVQRGLERAMFMDVVNLTMAGLASERNFTTLASWLTLPAQVKIVEAGYASALLYPGKTGWLRTLARQGQVYLRVGMDPYPQQAVLHAWRPAHTLVNGGDSLVGPQDDTDYVHIPLSLAAAAGHIECWRYFPEFMANRSVTGKKTTQEQAAAVFTLEQRKMRKNNPSAGDQIQLEWSAQGSSLGLIP